MFSASMRKLRLAPNQALHVTSYGHTTLVCTMEGWMSILHTLWHEGIAARGSTEIGSWLLKHVSLMSTSASHLILYSDSNGRQNQNIYLPCLYLQIAGNPLTSLTTNSWCLVIHTYPATGIFEWRHHPQIYTPQDLLSYMSYQSIFCSRDDMRGLCGCQRA